MAISHTFMIGHYTVHSAFTSVIASQTNMHRVQYVLHREEWNSVGSGVLSTKYNV